MWTKNRLMGRSAYNLMENHGIPNRKVTSQPVCLFSLCKANRQNVDFLVRLDCTSYTYNQGCGVGVDVGVGVGRSRRFCPESESELESVKFYRLRLRSGVAVCRPSTENYFGRTVMHSLENIERQKEKESGSVGKRLKRHLVIEFCPIWYQR